MTHRMEKLMSTRDPSAPGATEETGERGKSSRRQFLQASATAGASAFVSTPAVAGVPEERDRLVL